MEARWEPYSHRRSGTDSRSYVVSMKRTSWGLAVVVSAVVSEEEEEEVPFADDHELRGDQVHRW